MMKLWLKLLTSEKRRQFIGDFYIFIYFGILLALITTNTIVIAITSYFFYTTTKYISILPNILFLWRQLLCDEDKGNCVILI